MDYEPGGRDIGHTYTKLSQMLQCTSDSPRSQVQNLAQPIIIHTEKQPIMLNLNQRSGVLTSAISWQSKLLHFFKSLRELK